MSRPEGIQRLGAAPDLNAMNDQALVGGIELQFELRDVLDAGLRADFVAVVIVTLGGGCRHAHLLVRKQINHPVARVRPLFRGELAREFRANPAGRRGKREGRPPRLCRHD